MEDEEGEKKKRRTREEKRVGFIAPRVPPRWDRFTSLVIKAG